MTTTKKKWDRSLGTSKKEQGIITPKDKNKENHRKATEHMWKERMNKVGITPGLEAPVKVLRSPFLMNLKRKGEEVSNDLSK